MLDREEREREHCLRLAETCETWEETFRDLRHFDRKLLQTKKKGLQLKLAITDDGSPGGGGGGTQLEIHRKRLCLVCLCILLVPLHLSSA